MGHLYHGELLNNQRVYHKWLGVTIQIHIPVYPIIS